MQFECAQCQAKYALPDERAAGKILKIRCRRCGNINTVDGSALPIPASAAPAPPPATAEPPAAPATSAPPFFGPPSTPAAPPPASDSRRDFEAAVVISQSTRMAIAEAGLANRAAKQRIFAGTAIAVVAVLAAALTLDALGMVQIPFVHSAVVATRRAVGPRPDPTAATAGTTWHSMLTDEERAALRRALLDGNPVEVRRVQEKARERARAIGFDLDLSDQVASSAPADDGFQRRDPEATPSIELSREQQLQLRELLALETKQQATIQVKPTVPEIRVPTRTEGGLSDEQIGKVVAENQGGIEFCANQEAKHGVKLPPNLNLALTVTGAGKVTLASIVDVDHRNSDLGRCLANKARIWRFPEFTGEPMEIEIPLKFTTAY
ncbi:MAG: zinc-ribbon domain-containing protein [Deltaproteobacteria bacterium]|nr:zinc-ribbon domain-containing protein [Deltaproteobacteria bacterium]